MKKLKNAIMGNTWKDEISLTILNIFRPYNEIAVLKLPFLEELYEKTLHPVKKCEIISDFIRFQSDFCASKSKL